MSNWSIYDHAARPANPANGGESVAYGGTGDTVQGVKAVSVPPKKAGTQKPANPLVGGQSFNY